MRRVQALSLVPLSVLSLAAWAAFATDVPATPAAPAAPATAVASSPAPEAQIPFANKGGIWKWQVVDNNTVLIESRGRKWYKATLFGNCINLSFAQRMSFESNPSGTFDKFSAIRSGNQRCPLVSLVETAAPQKKPNAKKSAPAAAPPPAAPTAPAAASP
jgi:hypothetical protein